MSDKVVKDEIMAIIENAKKAQERFLQTERGREIYERQQQNEIERKEGDLIKPYRACEIPGKIGWELALQRTYHDRQLELTDVDSEISQAFAKRKLLILLCGVVGTGKTISACRWLAKVRGYYVRADDFCQLRPAWDGDRERFKKYRDAPNLVIDEVGMEITNDDIFRIESLIHHRVEGRLKTIAIANMTPKRFLATYGERVGRRLYAYGHQLVANEILCPGELRKQRGKQTELF